MSGSGLSGSVISVDPEIKMYISALTRTAVEVVVDVVPCPVCKSKAGQYCHNPYTSKVWVSITHLDRRSAANAWRKKNIDQWRDIRRLILERILRIKWEVSPSARSGPALHIHSEGKLIHGVINP